jgi:hypothetical protein
MLSTLGSNQDMYHEEKYPSYAYAKRMRYAMSYIIDLSLRGEHLPRSGYSAIVSVSIGS